MQDLDHLIQMINSYEADIKAEVLVADLIQNGFTPFDYLVFFESTFRRGYSKDILKVDRITLNDIQEVIAFYLARNGLYDLLPEGLFHASPEMALSSGKGMASDSRKEAKIERETRKFFLPFENEFFFQRAQLEIQERLILQRLNDNSLDQFFFNFWKIDQSLPQELNLGLIAMLPFIKEIVGDFQMTANCLKAILDEEVTHVVEYSQKSFVIHEDSPDPESSLLGQASLGKTLITCGCIPESCKRIRFLIGPIKKTGIDPYLKGGGIARFIDCFTGFFIPLEMDVEFEVVLPQEQQGFVIGSGQESPALGYGTRI